MVNVDQSVTNRQISELLHEGVKNIVVVLNGGVSFIQDVLAKSFPCVKRCHGVSGDDAAGSTHKHSSSQSNGL